ncbi:endonuclease/exonuclease/phosphatase family protein [Salinimicrobium sediminilitoris]|uniref:endonuclease/exonuclease/phosphatase family protein n=1 Tax=Salinimicrobium sediminilitoris TaxID=2876715 RepID=UPI001E62EBA3|nr:endonuclease/exonuclease/phosphatase family protein [Salinimicrobium sediminilitoris]MCC8359693.1 endonuclease/exonuclease/phosphatase family protein [Salinimicrobium sediminilitoris]
MIRSILLKIVVVISVIVVVLSVLSLIHDLTYWYAKILDFPRTQYLILSLVFLLLFLILNRKWTTTSYVIAAGLIIAITIHSIKIAPYFFGEKVVPEVSLEESNSNSSVEILIVNVLMTNKNAARLREIIDEHQPDMVLAMEVNSWWVEQLDEMDYPFAIKYPLDNAYGMVLYSRLPLSESEVKFFRHQDVPSFHTVVELRSGEKIKFHGVHPVAPFPSEKYPDNVGLQELALSKVGKLVAADTLPSIVAGDFNDVSWSSTTKFFEEHGNLKNVRLGRGLYNSFSAQSFLMRWPLDHFFVTSEFGAVKLQKLDEFGSDHFPIIAELVLQ